MALMWTAQVRVPIIMCPDPISPSVPTERPLAFNANFFGIPVAGGPQC